MNKMGEEMFLKGEEAYVEWRLSKTDDENNAMDEEDIVDMIADVPIDKKGKRLLTEAFEALKGRRGEMTSLDYGVELTLMICDISDKFPEEAEK